MTGRVGDDAEQAPLEELMIAMDVVDTLRHREMLIDRELNLSGRRERLLERLREIYRAQGIEVSETALEAGVDALEQERFAYTPTPAGFSTAMAKLYIRRGRWLNPLLALLAIALLVSLVWHFGVTVIGW